MAFATSEDVAARLGRDLTDQEETTVALLLDGATAVIAMAAGKDDDWSGALDPVPDVLRFLCVELVCRALANPQGLTSLQETLGEYSHSARYGEAGLFLTEWEERIAWRAVNADEAGSVVVNSLIGEADDA